MDKKYFTFDGLNIFGILSAQNSNATIEVGTILSISEPVSDTYKHIDFPRKKHYY